MFHRLLIIIGSFGLFGSVIIDGRCITDNCGDKDLKHQSSRSARLSLRNCHYHITKFCSNCKANSCNSAKNSISDNCWKCCCKRLSLTDDNDAENDATGLTTGCGSDCNSKVVEDPDNSREDDGSATSALSTADKTSSEVETKSSHPPPSCPSPSPCPATTSSFQRFGRDSDTQLSRKNRILPILPEGVPIIPSPQLDMLLNGDNIGFGNTHDLHSPAIKSSSFEKPLAQVSKRPLPQVS